MILMCVVARGTAEENHISKVRGQAVDTPASGQEEEPPEGYYAFVESPNAEPPKVRPPPYIDSDKECYGTISLVNESLSFSKIILHSFPINRDFTILQTPASREKVSSRFTMSAATLTRATFREIL